MGFRGTIKGTGKNELALKIEDKKAQEWTDDFVC